MTTPSNTTPSEGAGARPALVDRLAARLPKEGRVLVLEQADAPPLALGGAIERRTLRGAAGEIHCGELEPGAWHAIVLAGRRPAAGWQPLLTELRSALAERGRLVLVVPIDGGTPDEVVSDLVGALFETGHCVVHEEVDGGSGNVAVAPATPTPPAGRAALVEARADDYLVRPYRDGDAAVILRLFDASFSPPRDPVHWSWKYRDNPFGTLAISVALARSGELVAHYAAYPVRFRRARRGGASESLLCHQVGDTMTDRRHRDVGRGRTSLLARTARHFYARRCAGKVAWNYGFNTGNIQRFSELFVGARKVWDVEVRRCLSSELRLAAPRFFRPYRASLADRIDGAFDDLFERVAPEYGLLVERRRAYLEWRYLRCPDRDFHLIRVDAGSRLVGWGVFRADGDRLLWGDALVDPAHAGAVSALLRRALAIEAGGQGRDRSVEGWFSRHPAWWNELLSTLGFVAATEPQGLGMVYVPFLEDPLTELQTGYYLTMGDGDLF